MPVDDVPEWVSSWKADDAWQAQSRIEAIELDTETEWVRSVVVRYDGHGHKD